MLKMTGGEAIKYRCMGALPFLSITCTFGGKAIKSHKNINRCLKMTGVKAIKYRCLKTTRGPPFSVNYMYTWWQGYQKSENIDRCLKMTGGEAINQCSKMTSGEAIKSWRISKLKDD